MVFRYDSGLDKITDLYEIITKYEIARLEGRTWYLENPVTKEAYLDENGNPIKCGSKADLFNFLKDNPTFTESYEKAVSDFINKTGTDISLIDEEDLAEITAMEKGVTATINNANDDSDDNDDVDDKKSETKEETAE